MIELKVKQVLRNYLKGENYKIWPPSEQNGWGPDVVGYHPDRHHLWIIEAKGDKSSSSDRRDAFEIALGRICQRGAGEWKQKAGYGVLLPADIVAYGLAFPEGEDYRYLCRQIRLGVRLALSLYLFF